MGRAALVLPVLCGRAGEHVGSARREVELVAVGVEQLELNPVDQSGRRGAEFGQTLDFDVELFSAHGEVEALLVAAILRDNRRATPGNLRAALGRLDGCLLILIPYQRPAQRCRPELPDLTG